MNTKYILASLLIPSALSISLPACATFVPGKIGTENRYQLSYRGDGISHAQGLLSGQPVTGDGIRTELRAQLETIQVTSSVLSVRLLAANHSLQINGHPQDLSAERAALEKPFYLAVDTRGRILSVSFASDVPIAARRILRTIVSGLEFVPSGSQARTWKVEQDTVNGPVQAAYRFVKSATVEKRVAAYPTNRRIGPKGTPQMHPATQGALAFIFQQGRLQSVGGAYMTQFRLADKLISEGREQFQLTHFSAQTESKAELGRLQGNYRAQCLAQAPMALHQFDTNAALALSSWTRALNGATVPSLLADLATDDTKEVNNDSALFDRLCALMTLHPETCTAFEQALSAAPPDRFSARMIVAALASVAGAAQEKSQAASPAAQAAERALYNVLASHATQPDMVVRVASSVGMIGAPGQEMERLLESLADARDPDISGSCTLALGGVAQHGAPAVARAAIAYMKRKLANADAVGKQTLLAALGNAGSADALSGFATYAHHASATLRATTMMSLRLVPGARATALLYQGLHDADPDVRLNAARAFEFRPFTVADIRAFTNLIATEKTERVRLALLDNLHLEAPYYPQVRAVMQHAAAHDASADIRKTVAGWLQS